jgi:hypothetical protein
MSGSPSPRPSSPTNSPSSSVSTPNDDISDEDAEALAFSEEGTTGEITAIDNVPELCTSIPVWDSELDEQQITLLSQTLEQAYLHQHPAGAIIVQTQDPTNALIIQAQHPILPTYNATDEINHYFSFGDFITKKGKPSFTVENVSNKVSMEFTRLLSAFILSDTPIPDTLSCYFGIHHGSHWTSLVIQASINILNKNHLMELRTFFNHLEKPYTARDYSTVVNLLLVIGGKDSSALINELSAQLKEMEPFHSIDEVLKLISTLKEKNSDSTRQSENWFVPFYQAAQITLMDSCNGNWNNTIKIPLLQIFPNVPIQQPRVPQQGKNHCGDNTIWNGFYYSTHGKTCDIRLSGSLRELTIKVCNAEVLKKTNPTHATQLEHIALIAADKLLLENKPLVTSTRKFLTPDEHILENKRAPDGHSSFLSRASVIFKLNDYLDSSLHIIKVFLIAVFSLNIFGLGFRKYLMARKLYQELSKPNNDILKTDTLIQQYDDYNTYLENHKPLLWFENFRPICPKNKKYAVSNCVPPKNSAFYKALHKE